MQGAILFEPVAQAGVGPFEMIDPDRALIGNEPVRQRDQEAPFEGADLRDVAGDAVLGLQAHRRAGNGRGEARRHAPYREKSLREITIDCGEAACRSHVAQEARPFIPPRLVDVRAEGRAF